VSTARLINRMPSLSAHFRVLAKLAVTIAIGVAILARTDIRDVVDRMSSMPLGTTLGCILIIVGLSLVVAARWHLILATMGSSLAFLESWRLVTIGLFFNQTLPSGLGGDAVRVWMMTSRGERLRTSFVSVAVDRIFALGAVAACMVGALPLLNGGPLFLPVLVLSLAGVLGFAFLLSWDAALSALGRVWPALATARIPKILVRGIDLGRDLSRTVLGVSGTLREGPLIMLLSLTNQIALGLVIYLIGRGLGAKIGIVDTLILFPPAMLLSMVPITLGGWGVREAAIVWLYGSVGVPADLALGISIMFGLVITAAGLPGGLLWLIAWLHPTDAKGEVGVGPR
jgi:glycosyltransferase 2 family protein